MKGAVWIAATGAQIGLVLLTVPSLVPGLGGPTWHHNASLLGAIVLCAAFGRRMLDRRFLGIGVLATTVLAILSGFLVLHFKPLLKATGFKDWAVWWHIAWSWLGLLFFVMHTSVNRSGLARSLRRMHTRARDALLYQGLLLAIVVLIPLTWLTSAPSWISDRNYLQLTLFTWIFLLSPAYIAWGIVQLRARSNTVPTWGKRPATQAFTDSWLLPMTILANISGFPMLYFDTAQTPLKFIAKYWHTWPSIAMTLLVFAHTIQFLPAMARHLEARRSGKSS
ncbi:MAG: hypothetical protein AABX89_08690 [Candidatus Thermoplasmatota archaeon]